MGWTNTGMPSCGRGRQRRTRLRRIRQQVPFGALDENTAQPKFADGAGQFTGAIVAAISIDGREAIDLASVFGCKVGDFIVDPGDRAFRHVSVGILQESRGRVDNAGRNAGDVERSEKRARVRKQRINLRLILPQRRRRVVHCRQCERRADVMIVKVHDPQWLRRLVLRASIARLRQHRAGCHSRSQCAQEIAAADRPVLIAHHHEVLPDGPAFHCPQCGFTIPAAPVRERRPPSREPDDFSPSGLTSLPRLRRQS